MGKRIYHHLSSIFGFILFGAALWVIWHQLRAYNAQGIGSDLQSIPLWQLLVSLGCVVTDYFVLTGYEYLSLTFIGKRLSYARTALASFIGHTFSVNINLITGSSVRYRIYSAWGLDAVQVTTMVVFCNLTFLLGYLFLAGTVFSIEPLAIPQALHLPFVSARPLGFIFLGILAMYLLWNAVWKRPIKIFRYSLPVTTMRLSLKQIGLSALDWSLAGGALYSLLPHVSGLNFVGFIGIYLLAQLGGQVSQAPAGLGVFEAIMLLLLGGIYPSDMLVGTLLVYRVFYYFMPLGVATIVLGLHEWHAKKKNEKSFFFLRRPCSAAKFLNLEVL